MSRLREARERAGLTQAELAELVGTSQPQIRRLEAGDRTLSKIWAEKLAPHVGMSAEELMFGSGQAGSEPTPPNYRPPPQFFGERDLPVYAAVEGGPGAMVVSTDPIEIVPRPWFMKEVREGFGVLITGDSMDPAFRPGDIAIVNPKLPPMRGKNMIFATGDENGEFRATIKELRGWDAKNWHVLQHNPPEGLHREFSLQKPEWPRALRVVGKLEGG